MADVTAVIKRALSKLGAPYVWGATGPGSFDCSGLMVWAFGGEGVSLPRTSQAQARYGKAVSLKDIRPGDLVTSNWGSGPSSHVALYIGNGKLVHAPRPGKPVTVANLDATYRSKVNAVRRPPGLEFPGVQPADWDDKLGDLLGDFFDWRNLPGLGGPMDPFGGAEGLGRAFAAVTEPLKTIGASMLSVGKFADFLLKLALPSTWVRIVCGLLGAVLLFLGLGFLVREATTAGGA